MKKRTIALLMAVVMLFGATVGGTIAWIQAKTGEVKNTFTVGDINIELKEHDYIQSSNSLDTSKEVEIEEDYKMIPGLTLKKDPFVRVKANSENCWVFVTVEKSTNFDTYMTFAIDSTWEEVTGATGATDNLKVYRYKTVVNNSTSDQLLNIINGTNVTVKNTVTKSQLEAAKTANPTLTFKAYAVQSDNLGDINTAQEIWDVARTAA